MGGTKKGKKGPPIPGGANVTVSGSFPVTKVTSTPQVIPTAFTLQSFTLSLTAANNLLVALANAVNNAALKKAKKGGGKKGGGGGKGGGKGA
jgi:hypothetical protein